MSKAMTTMSVARERQLDWLLGELLGGGVMRAEPSLLRARTRHPHARWITAALAVLAAATALGVALLAGHERARDAQQPAPPVDWYEAHGPASIGSIPAGVVNLRCYDFDDDALAHIPHFAKLERLDLSGMDVNAQGYAVSLKISDAGLAHLAGLPDLRWLSLAGCHEVKGTGFVALEALPMLEHLDLTYTGVESPAVERLDRLASLRELSLSYCMGFHGRSLAEVAKIPGLRRLELRGCTTLSARDVAQLAKLSELRYLDLRDCQGRFRGQTASGFSAGGEEPPPPPVQDGIGITDASVAALAGLKLETLLLGGSESLTDAIGETLAKMPTLRSLDLSNLPKATGALLAKVPPDLESLALDENPQFGAAALRQLPKLSQLREWGLSGLPPLGTEDLGALLRGKSLHVLRLSGTVAKGKALEVFLDNKGQLTADAGAIVARQSELRRLELANVRSIDAAFLRELTELPRLAELDLTSSAVGSVETMTALASCRALRSLKLTWCKKLDLAGLEALAGAPLQELDLYGTNLKPEEVHDVAKAWPGCLIKMPKGQRYRAP
ncbi:MAG TPA: hypothetical protein VFZ65_23635 [Planctomycetota bacterium]|nr:hypothetical protein [Planctomycetota bacterium]